MAKCFDIIIYCRFVVLIAAQQVTRQLTLVDEKFSANENLSSDKYLFNKTVILSQVILFLEGLFNSWNIWALLLKIICQPPVFWLVSGSLRLVT